MRAFSVFLAIVTIVSIVPVIETDANAYADAKPLPKLTGNQAQDVVSIALSQLGYSEAKNGGTVYGAWWSGVVKSGYNYTKAGWCAMFACWCANNAGAGMNVAFDKSSAQVQSLMDWLKKNGKVDTSFSSKPQPGDFIFFGYGKSADHVAIVVEYDADTNVVTFVGGNQSNKVKKTTTTWSSKGKYGKQKVVGYGRPNYGRVKPLDAPSVKTDKSSYFQGEEVAISWSKVSGSTGYHLTVARDGKVVVDKDMGKKTSYTFKKGSDGKYTVKVTATNGYVPSQAGSKKFTISNIKPNVRLWLSDAISGAAVESCMAGQMYQLCYEVYDEISGELLQGVLKDDFTVKLKITDQDGKVLRSEKYGDDQAKLGFFFDQAGEYELEAKVSGAFKSTVRLKVQAGENPKRIHSSADATTLALEGAANTGLVYVWTSSLDGEPLLLWQRDNTNVSCAWGQPTEDGRTPLLLTANSAGTTVITLAAKVNGGDTILDLVTLTVTVDATGYSVSYDTNGAQSTLAPQVKPQGGALILHGEKPERKGYIFLGWSTSPEAVTAEYQPGMAFTVDAHTTLYAVWSETFLSGDANVDGTVNVKDWNCLYEHGNEQTTITGGALYPADVNNDGTVNMKDWTRLYEHVCEVDPLW